MSDAPQGEGWWLASDGRWYPPQSMPAPSAPPPPPPTPTHRGPSTSVLWVVLVALVATAAGLAYVLLSRNSDDTAAPPDDGEATEVLLEPLADTGPDAFTASTTLIEVADLPTTLATVPGVAEAAEPTDDGVTIVGTTPGLYGGSRDDSTCDVAALTDYLAQSPEKAAAFAGVVGTTPDGVGEFVSTLTPTVLTVDTRVTNHGFRDGAATARQSVLQAGTAVLVDERGVPRVRCSCGNPLAPPRGPATATTGTPWDGFDLSTTATVTAGTATGSFELVDLQTGELYEVPTGATTPLADAPVVIRADRLEIVGADGSVVDTIPFTTPARDAIARLTEVLGEPDSQRVLPGDQSCSLDTRVTTWGTFQVLDDSAAGGNPEFAVVHGMQDILAGDERITTVGGVALGMTVDEAIAAVPDPIVERITFEGADYTYVFLEGERYLSSGNEPNGTGVVVTAIDGTVTAISSPIPLIDEC